MAVFSAARALCRDCTMPARRGNGHGEAMVTADNRSRLCKLFGDWLWQLSALDISQISMNKLLLSSSRRYNILIFMINGEQFLLSLAFFASPTKIECLCCFFFFCISGTIGSFMNYWLVSNFTGLAKRQLYFRQNDKELWLYRVEKKRQIDSKSVVILDKRGISAIFSFLCNLIWLGTSQHNS